MAFTATTWTSMTTLTSRVRLPESSFATVRALARALGSYDPDALARGAHRARLARELCDRLGVDATVARDAVAAALLSEVGLLVSHTRADADDPAAAVLAASLVSSDPGLDGVTRALRHHLERWDGRGGPHALAGPDIPIEARLVTLARELAAGETAAALAGSVLDPDLVERAIAARPFAELSAEASADAGIDALLADLEPFDDAEVAALNGLRTIGRAIRSAQRVDLVLSFIAQSALDALGASTLNIARRDADRRELHVLVVAGYRDAGVEQFPVDVAIPLSSYPMFTGFSRGREHLLTAEQSNDARRYLTARGISSEMAAPIVIGGEVWGMMWASTRGTTRPFDQHSLAALRVAVVQAAIGIEHADRLAGLETLALRDPLTGLANRRVLDRELRELFRRAPLDRRDAALIMIDVDELKQVNDVQGHAAGDRVLIDTAAALRASVAGHSDAVVCRIGGDEFCILLLRGGLLFSERIVDEVEHNVRAIDASRSVSCGIAVADPAVANPSQLLRAADIAQYDKKRARKGLPPDPRGAATPGRRARRDH